MINKKIFEPALLMSFVTASLSISTASHAELSANAILTFSPGVTTCTYHGDCFVKGGSYFSVDAGTYERAFSTTNGVENPIYREYSAGDGRVTPNELNALFMNNELILSTAQTSSGSHLGAPSCVEGTVNKLSGTCNNLNPSLENSTIDQPWGDYKDGSRYNTVLDGDTGMHSTTSTTHVLSTTGNTATMVSD